MFNISRVIKNQNPSWTFSKPHLVLLTLPTRHAADTWTNLRYWISVRVNWSEKTREPARSSTLKAFIIKHLVKTKPFSVRPFPVHLSGGFSVLTDQRVSVLRASGLLRLFSSFMTCRPSALTGRKETRDLPGPVPGLEAEGESVRSC